MTYIEGYYYLHRTLSGGSGTEKCFEVARLLTKEVTYIEGDLHRRLLT